ncbi:MAG: MBOAT family protein [Myxococcales bacterium]|nr:MBOAT family protein [Myxococcales bacterium]
MLFNSLQFALFFPVVVVAYYAIPQRNRWILLLAASYAFYMAWEPAYGLLLLISTTVDWWVSNRLPAATDQAHRRRLLAVSLVVNLSLLFSFKYYNLINTTFVGIARWFGADWPLPESEWMLPVGISFYTFQTIGYTVDVYRGRQEPETSFGRMALYVSFFPQLVAGPIERANRLLPQLRETPGAAWEQVVSGLRLAAWGLFKKVVVADRLAVVVDAVYTDPTQFKGFALTVASVLFSWQVYCDFSGYSDIAIGIARVFGIDLMRNFDQPHLSRSMTEWWSRWHISLSSWFRDYIYIPLGGNRSGPLRWSFNIAVVFIVSGLWHGASWRFAVWGALHAALVIGDRFTRPLRDSVARSLGVHAIPGLRRAIQMSLTFVIWTLTLVLFRAESLSDAVWVYTHFTSGWTRVGDPEAFAVFLSRVHLDGALFAYCLLLGPLVDVVDYGWRNERWRSAMNALPTVARWGVDYLVIFSILFLGVFTDTPFVYFQF